MNKLKELRKEKGMTIKTMSEQLGLHINQYCRYENGGNLRLDVAFRIAKYFGVTVEDIWGE